MAERRQIQWCQVPTRTYDAGGLYPAKFYKICSRLIDPRRNNRLKPPILTSLYRRRAELVFENTRTWNSQTLELII